MKDFWNELDTRDDEKQALISKKDEKIAQLEARLKVERERNKAQVQAANEAT